MDIYGLVGRNISHSYSPEFFNQFFAKKKINAEYRLFDIEDISEISSIIDSDKNIKGLNVTIPYKRSVLNHLDKIDNTGILTGSVNTIKVERNGNSVRLNGFNTDVIGFEKSILPLIKTHKNIKAFVLGTGGGALSVAFVLRKLGVFFYFVSRNPDKVTQLRYSSLSGNDMAEHKLIINASPLGMWPDTNALPPIPYEFLTKDHILYDLIYNPEETQFLKMGKEKGATIMNGESMLKEQALASWKRWTERKRLSFFLKS